MYISNTIVRFPLTTIDQSVIYILNYYNISYKLLTHSNFGLHLQLSNNSKLSICYYLSDFKVSLYTDWDNMLIKYNINMYTLIKEFVSGKG